MSINVGRKTIEMSKLEIEYQKHGHNHKFKHIEMTVRKQTQKSQPLG